MYLIKELPSKKDVIPDIHPEFGSMPTERNEGYNQALSDIEAQKVSVEDLMKIMAKEIMKIQDEKDITIPHGTERWLAEAISTAITDGRVFK